MTKLATEERVEHAPRPTPTPWTIRGGMKLYHIECDDTGEAVCSLTKSRKADAELIVAAVNEREALVSALRANLESVIALLQEAEHSDDETEKELTDRLFSIQNRAKYIESAIRAALQAAGE